MAQIINVALSKGVLMPNVLIRVNILVAMVLLKKFPMVLGIPAGKIVVRKIFNAVIIPLAVTVIAAKAVVLVVKQLTAAVGIAAAMKKVMFAVIKITHLVVMQQIA